MTTAVEDYPLILNTKLDLLLYGDMTLADFDRWNNKMLWNPQYQNNLGMNPLGWAVDAIIGKYMEHDIETISELVAEIRALTQENQ